MYFGLPINMSQSQAQPLIPSKITSGHHTVVLRSISYPSRSHDISWSKSVDPKRFSRKMDVRPTLAVSYASATAIPVMPSNTVTTNEVDTEFCTVTHALRGIRGLIWHELLIFSGGLKLLVQKLISPAPQHPLTASSES